VGYVLDAGGVLRLIGLARDPNFYSLWMTPLLITGLMRGRLGTVLWLPIALSLGMALSRSFFVAILFTSFTLIPMLWSVRTLRKYFAKITIMPLIMISVILCVSVLWTDTEYISKRIELADKTIRFERWHMLNHAIVEDWNPIWGSGLRSTQLLLKGVYSHSTYLDALFETGLVGFFLWLTILILLGLLCLNGIKSADSELLPWIYTWFVLIIMFFSFSLLYHPFTWMVIGILINGTKPRGISDIHTRGNTHASLIGR
jgi:O-antigen ligase